MFIFKVFLTFPIFCWFHFRLFFKYRGVKKNPQTIDEESNYFFAKRYARYLLWLYGYKVTTAGLQSWIFKPSLLVLNNQHFIVPLLLMKLNAFDQNPPLMFLFENSFFDVLPKTLLKLYSLINVFVFKMPISDRLLEQMIQQSIVGIRLPRSVCLFFDTLKNGNCFQLLKIASGGFASLLVVKITLQEKQISLQIKQLLNAKDIVKLDSKLIITRLDDVFKD